MEFIPRVRSAEIFKFIGENLQHTEDWSKEFLIEQFTEMLHLHPDNILISAVLENAECVAFTISIAPPNAPFVVLAQAWAKAGIPETYAKAGFAAVISWAQQHERTAIRCETQRGDAIVRKWGFQHFAEVLSFDVSGVNIQDFFKENSNGIGRRNNINEHSESSTVENQQGVGGTDSQRTEAGNSAVQWQPASGDGPGVRAGEEPAESVQSEPELAVDSVGSGESVERKE